MCRAIIIALVPLFTWSCALVGPSCISRQQRGTVASLNGEVAAGQTTVHLLPYGTEGSQNDVEISVAGNPRIQVYATRAACTNFSVPPPAGQPECALLASGSRSLIITHGRGNPPTLGPTPEYKLWIVNEDAQSVRYTLTATSFYGPDC